MDGHRLATQLRDHQRVILANIDRAKRLLRAADAPDPAEIARLRWELIRLLTAYRIFKHREIFDPLIARGSSAQMSCAQRMKADCIRLETEVRDFVARRSRFSAQETVEQFRADVFRFLTGIAQHLEGEERAATALLGPITAGTPLRAALPARRAEPQRAG